MPEYITREGMERLNKRISFLLETERPKVVKQVATAREMGDLKENAEYHAARERQRHIDDEVGRLKSRAAILKVVDTDTIPKDAVRFGAYVDAEEISKSETHHYRLVGVDEVNHEVEGVQLISVASPIGKAMIGKKVGEMFVVKAPIGDRNFKVLNIK